MHRHSILFALAVRLKLKLQSVRDELPRLRTTNLEAAILIARFKSASLLNKLLKRMGLGVLNHLPTPSYDLWTVVGVTQDSFGNFPRVLTDLHKERLRNSHRQALALHCSSR